ncbi:MAG: hypothetical protein ACT4P0_13350 [Panacagrimonas sp.]
MQSPVIIIPAAAVSRLKKQAKTLQRTTTRPHHEALEEVARAAGFDNWHQVSLAEKATQDIERRFRSGVFALIDVKEAQDAEDFEDASEILALRDKELLQWLRQHHDNQAASDDQLREDLHADYRVLRYAGADRLSGLPESELVSRVEALLFWTPDLIWRAGKCIDPSEVRAAARNDDEDDENEDDGPDEPMPDIDEGEQRQAFKTKAGTRLVTHSPDTMERYDFISGPRKAWHWCLHCERAYPLGSYRQIRDLQMCPYEGCDGDTVMDLWTWQRVREANPGYPEVPELGVVYGLYG